MDVQTKTWVLPNRLSFPEWIYHRFHPSKYVDDNEVQDKKVSGVRLSPHQKLVKDLLNAKSPYRGLLLFHGLGVGKTRASILTAEDFIRNRKKIVVMLPASLQKNYRNEILNSSRIGRFRWKRWYKVTLDTSKPEQMGILLSLQEEFPFDDDFIRKHATPKKSTDKFAFWIPYVPAGLDIPSQMITEPMDIKKLPSKDAKDVQATHEYLIDHVYEFINYNGLLKSHLNTKYKADFFEGKLVIIDEAHNFITQSMNEDNISAKLYQRLMNTKNVRFLLLTGTPMINQPSEIAYLMNLLRGPIQSVVYDFGARQELPSESDLEKLLTTTMFPGTQVPVSQLIDHFELSSNPKQKTVEVTLLPQGYVRTVPDNKSVEVQYQPRFHPTNMPFEKFKSGLNQAFEKGLKTLKNKDKWEVHSALPYDEKEFKDLFITTTEDGVPEMKNEQLFIQRCMGLTSYFKGNDPKYFPTQLPLVVRRMPLTDHQFMTYLNNRHDEQKMERKSQLAKIRRGLGAGDDGKTVYRTFSRMACNFVFPKTIKRSFPMTIRAALREMESENVGLVDIEKKVDETYEKERKTAMEQLMKDGEAYLSEKALLHTYSPKMGQIMVDLQGNPGKGLFYSQFREMEGLGIFSLALQVAGWIEMDIKKGDNGNYEFVNEEEVLQEKYNNKRYVVFNQDRARSDVLLKLFNGEWKQLPKEALHLAEIVSKAGIKDNLRGTLAKLMMISQSGAEGISLKHVRQVYILEPFWNQVRIDQVIGRAARTNSHVDLPPEERTVQVYMYVSTFTQEQIEKDHTMRHLDHERTSDEHILGIAQTKRKLIQQFENSLKTSAIDCLNNASKNNIRQDNLQCYVAPIDKKKEHEADLSYLPDIEDHVRLQDKRDRLIGKKKVQGRIVKKGKKHLVLVEKDKTPYEKEAYVNAGVLVTPPPSS